MDATLTFTVGGAPVPQPRPRVSTWGGRGRAYTPKGHAVHAFRQAIAIRATLAAKAARWARADRPLAVEVACWFVRPPSHLTAAGTPRPTAPAWPCRADVDNLAKAVLDSITDSGVVWGDDDQVVRLVVSKAYGPRAGVVVTVRPAP